MKKGVFYSVGVGPGDPMLLTLKAVQIIQSCDVVAVPASGAKENIALKIAHEYTKGKRIIHCDMPMTRNKLELEQFHQQATEQMAALLNLGKVVAFLTLGDPTVYSTPLYIHTRLAKMGFETQIISGVTSFCAAAASLGISLCEGSQPLHIIPASYQDIETSIALSGTKVLMKSGKSLVNIKRVLSEKQHSQKQVMMVTHASTQDEKIARSLDEITDDASYFSVIVVKE